MRTTLVALFLFAAVSAASGQPVDSTRTPPIPGPSFRDVLSLKTIGSQAISPGGDAVAFTVSEPDWEENRYDSEIWLVRNGRKPFQLTRTLGGSSGSLDWSPDGRWISFIAKRGESSQLFLISPDGGEAFPVSDLDEEISGYQWAPDGKRIALALPDPEPEELENRKEQYGDFSFDDTDYRMTHLWVMDVDLDQPAKPVRLTEGDTLTVGSFSWSPDGSRIAFDHRPDPLINSYAKTDVSVLNVEVKTVRPLVRRPGSDARPIWSPDGNWILFNTANGDSAYYLNGELARIPSTGGDIFLLSQSFDEDAFGIEWTREGIYFLASQGVARQLFLLDPETREIRSAAERPEMIWSVDFSDDGRTVSLAAESRTVAQEIYRSPIDGYDPRRLTHFSDQMDGWNLGSREVITWNSRDGTPIEGVLFKPSDFDPSRRYPLFVIIHGGPTGTSRPNLISSYVYPVTQWLNRGALVLMPNYRGSAGYGEAFRSLNVRNLGVGDAWDVESGVDFLVAQGLVHPDSVAAMGWSQGGYISAFLTTASDRFKAISVGAGISNWMTYYVNTDIHPFTRHYLQATPWDDPEIYAKTSPMTYINTARTPTLIQHGEFDRRVPIPNAYELLQGLRDRRIPAELVVYKGFGHGISKPKEQLAATWHNWQWFERYLWGREVSLPIEAKKDEE